MGINIKRGSATSTAATKSTTPRGLVLWDDAPTEFVRRVALTEIYGDTNTGKTTLALSAPGPIAFLHAAEKVDGVIQDFARQKKIRVHNFNGTFTGRPEDIARAAMEVWKGLVAAWDDAWGWARTIVVDTHTEAWELIRIAYFGGYKPEKGRPDANYGPVNAEWRSLFKKFRAQDRCNLIVIGQTKDEYKVASKGIDNKLGERTGKTIRAGQREVPYFADVVLRMSREGNDFVATVEKGWFHAELEGTPFINEDARYANIMGFLTQTREGEWGGE